ncbi:DUF3500 domain-containing protein [Rathayibacter sp. SD072]|uniref:DUF3500 domain-containing protein n=1 Tax=Rathayibacter sp. SD072 TaxID=2781731 RepID=UPI001A976783|nr:DUF3500 domain-containing protein [Rathayibacter sp. SD072]
MVSTSSLTQSISRRGILAGIPLAALVLAGCTTNGSTSTATGTATTAPTGTPAAAGSVAALAQAFQASLSAEQQATLVQSYTLTNAELWSNFPQALLSGMGGGAAGGAGGARPSGASGFPTDAARPSGAAGGAGGGGAPAGLGGGARLGLSIGDLSDAQLALFQSLLKATTGTGSGVGYDEIQQHLNADDYLADNGGGDDYGRSQFFVAFLGVPQDTGTWEFQFGGHHLAVANTYINGSLAGATPSFRGIEPNGDFEWDGSTNHPMAAKEAAFTAAFSSLTSDQQASAKLSDVYSDLVLGPGSDWAFPATKEGLQVSGLSADQKALVLAAIASYVNDISDAEAATILATYKAELDDTYLAYSGSTTFTQLNDYFRIDGPSVWIELSLQNGIVLSGYHPHTVWRDHNTDYGGTKS